MSGSINFNMIGVLVRKDLGLVAAPALTYTAAGALALGLMTLPGAGFYAGVVLLVTALMALSFHPTIATAVGERKVQTLAFVMTFPITPADYVIAKIGANLAVFFVPWTALLLGCAALIHAQPSMPDGLIPLATILFGVIAVSAVVILCVAIVTESAQLTIAVQVASNLAFQGIMYSAANDPVIKQTMGTETVAWSGPVFAYLGAYVLISLLAMAIAVWLQSRKTTFI